MAMRIPDKYVDTSKPSTQFDEPRVAYTKQKAKNAPTPSKSGVGDFKSGNYGSTGTKTYTVSSGDSLSAIASRAGLSLSQLLKLNPQITNPNLIYPGQKINTSSGYNTTPTKSKPKASTPVAKPRATSTRSTPVTTPKAKTTNTVATKSEPAPTPTKTIAPTPEPEPAPEPAEPTVTQFTVPNPTTDATYIGQLAQLHDALQNLQKQNELAQSQYDSQLSRNYRDLGYDEAQNKFVSDPLSDLGSMGAYGNDVRANQEDFASRGNYFSGARLDAANNISQLYNQRIGDMQNQREDYAGRLTNAEEQLAAQNDKMKDAYLAEAVSRLAAQYGVDPSTILSKEGAGSTQYTKTVTPDGKVSIVPAPTEKRAFLP